LQHPRVKASGQRKILTIHSTSATKSYRIGLISGVFLTNSLGVAARLEGWVLDHRVSTVWRHYHAKSKSSIKRNKPSHMMPSQFIVCHTIFKGFSPCKSEGLSSAPQFAARESTYELQPRSPTKKDLPEIARESLGQSSISDRPLERYTKHVFLGER
jgi:hypothetical protein